MKVDDEEIDTSMRERAKNRSMLNVARANVAAFRAEVWRRRVLHWAFGWVFVVALAAVGFTQLIMEVYAVPRNLVDVTLFISIVGLFVCVVVAWYHGESGPQSVPKREVWLLASLGAIGVIGAPLLWTREPADPGTSTVVAPDLGRNSLAVLPFRNNVTDPTLDWLGSGLADLLTTNLAQLPDVLVVGRQSLYDLLMESGRSEEDQIPEPLAMTVARGAGARLLLWGGVMGTAGDMRIDAQLIEVENGTVASADFVRGARTDVFELVDTLTARLAVHLSGVPPSADIARISQLGTRDMEAWAAFHRGNALARAGDLEEAEAYYERAAEIDTAFALPLLASREAADIGRLYSPHVFWFSAGVSPANFEEDALADLARGRSEAERRRADWQERRTGQLVRRLPEDLRRQLEGLSGDELRVTLDSLTGRTRSAVRLLFGELSSVTGPTDPPPDPPEPQDRR